MATTSITKTSHSANHAQKKTRIRLPIAYGLTSDVDSQIPTPVRAPVSYTHLRAHETF